MQSTSDIAYLMQKPKKWTFKHLDAARAKVINNVTAEELFGQDYVPVDGDPGTMLKAAIVMLG